MKPYLKCIKCLSEYPLNKDVLTCPNHSPYYSYLVVMYPKRKILFDQQNTSCSWIKYKDLLPIATYAIHFSEQKTPLIHIKKFGKKYNLPYLYVKDESKNPTGSFKDKESFVAINKAKEWGVKNIFVVSSGNAAVSTAAYAHKAEIGCECIVSDHLSVGKRLLLGLYGGKVVEQKGSYEELFRNAIDTQYTGWNCTPGINPLKDEGVKIIGLEIWEEMGVPDVIVVPSGNGTLLFGIYKAFKELQYFGFIEHLPQMIGVQITGAAPLQKAYEEHKEFVVLPNDINSVAEGIIAQESYTSPKVMLALKETKGTIITVSDVELTNVLQEIIHVESLIPEPTSAVVYAAVKKLSHVSNKKIVLVQSAGGTKNLKEIIEQMIVTKKGGN